MKSIIAEWVRFIGTVLVLVFAINTIAFASFHIPSVSMVPTLAVGDRVVVTKFSYGYSRYSVPLGLSPAMPTDDGRIFSQLPERGDIIVFRHTQDSTTMIKRLIGLPGDRIQVKAGRLIINGELVERTLQRQYTFTDQRDTLHQVREFNEVLPGGFEHTIIEITDNGALDNTPEFLVPEGHVFMMGDNRDMSADSRRINDLGFVPVENLMGPAQIISYSLHNCGKRNPDICNSSRIFKRLY
jgi:signal peptidase I